MWESGWPISKAAAQAHANAWESWFEANFPNVERFIYVVDESTNYAQTEKWASWVHGDAGAGGRLSTFAPIDLIAANQFVPDMTTVATYSGTVQPDAAAFQAAVDAIHAQEPARRFYEYNGLRPLSGSFGTEDEGTSLRELAWGQYAKGIDRWFFWSATQYLNESTNTPTDVFNTAQTFGAVTSFDPKYGQQGNNSANGDGLLMYPGTDTVFPASSYGVLGPFASLRMKHWRRGIQDGDYLALAAAKKPLAVKALTHRMVPRVLWDIPANFPGNGAYTRSGIRWSNVPDDWEAARAQLAHIIDGR